MTNDPPFLCFPIAFVIGRFRTILASRVGKGQLYVLGEFGESNEVLATQHEPREAGLNQRQAANKFGEKNARNNLRELNIFASPCRRRLNKPQGRLWGDSIDYFRLTIYDWGIEIALLCEVATYITSVGQAPPYKEWSSASLQFMIDYLLLIIYNIVGCEQKYGFGEKWLKCKGKGLRLLSCWLSSQSLLCS